MELENAAGKGMDLLRNPVILAKAGLQLTGTLFN